MQSDQIIIVLFGALYFAFIAFTRRKGDFEEFSVAGRGLGGFMIFASICASYLGPAWTMGLAREGYSSGMFLAFIAPAMGLTMMVIAFFLPPKIRRKFSSSFSVGDVVGGPHSHNHAIVKAMVGVIGLLTMSALVIAMSYAGGELINNVFGFPKFWSIVVITTVVMLYSLFGGIRATIQTDVIQFLHFAVLIPILAILIVVSASFSWADYSHFASEKTMATFEASSVSVVLGFLLVFLTIAGYDPPIVSRYMASRNDIVAKRSTFWAGAFITMWTVLMLFIGSAGAYLYPQFANDDQVLLNIASVHFPGILYGIFIIAMIGVVMSSQDTFLNNAGVSFAQDILPRVNTDISDSQKLFFSKVYTVFIGLVSIVIASFVGSALSFVLIILDYYTCIMLVVTLFAILKNQHYWQSAVMAMVAGFLFKLCWDQAGNDIVPSIAVGIMASLIAYLGTDLYCKLQKQRPHSVGQ